MNSAAGLLMRPKIFCEAVAKTYEAEAEAEAGVSNVSCNIYIITYHIS